MTDALVSPSRTVTIGAKDYRLDGSFATLRAVQEYFRKDVVQLLVRMMDMRLDEVASLVAIASGNPDKPDEIGQLIVDELGTMTAAYGTLKTELFAWLNIAVSPKAEREKKSAEMTAILASRSPSPGPTTSGSPSDPSAGSPPNSGEVTSGN